MEEPISREIGRMNIDRKGVGRFMGSSSGIFFIGTAEQRLASISTSRRKVEDALLRVDVDDESIQFSLHGLTEGMAMTAPLPVKEVAKKYIDTWFDFWGESFPILHRPSFMKSVETINTTPPETHSRIFLAQYHLILALGCRHLLLTGEMNEGVPTVKTDGKDLGHFYQSRMYHNDVLAVNNLATLQFQELLTLWYLYTGKRSLAFQMTGSMVRLALELGLHRHTRRFNFDPLTTELRKRTFWVCYMLDQ